MENYLRVIIAHISHERQPLKLHLSVTLVARDEI